MIGIVADIIEQALHQARGHAGPAHRRRAGDGLPPFVAGHARHQVLAVVDRLRQVAELGTVAQEIRAHGDDHINRKLLLRDGVEQQLNKGRGQIRGVFHRSSFLKAEELLELIDHQQQVVFFRQACLAVRFGDPQCAALQGDQGEGGLHGIAAAVLIEDAGTVEGFRQITDGIAPGTHDGNPPVGAGSGHHSSQDVRQQAGAHQGGFAAAGRADHRQEALVAQPGQQLIALPVTTKEEEILI